MGHSHHHHGDPSEIGERRLWWAVLANMLLTVAQIIGGIISGSLSLVADALHNFSDAASLLIVLVAIRIDEVISAMQGEDGVSDVHHVHVRQLDKHRNALEAHVVLSEDADMDSLKGRLKDLLLDKFEIEHSTLEFEIKAALHLHKVRVLVRLA